MLELGVGADIVRGVGAILWGILAIALLVALIKPKTIIWKALSTLLVLAVFFGPMVPGALRSYEHKQRYEKAKALFDERCKTAGEKIYRTVEGVEGIRLLNVRPERISDSSQFDSDDQYGYNVGGETYVRYYLIGSKDSRSRYHYVETEKDGIKYRQTTPLSAELSWQYWSKGGGAIPVESEQISKYSSRYSIEWKDISSKEDRNSWVAGGLLKIIDQQTGEVLGERIGYLFESGMGSTAGARSPWSWARYYAPSCPSVNDHNRVFVEKVLKPLKESK